MKSLIKHLALLMLFSLLIGCSNSQYGVVCEDGKYYLTLYDIENTATDSGCLETMGIAFDSVERMISAITTGDFSDNALMEINHFPKDDNNRVILFNLDALYEPVLPDIFEEYIVIWRGQSYWFDISSAFHDAHATLSILSQSNWETKIHDLENRNDALSKQVNISDMVIKHDPERNATVYLYRNGSNTSELTRECVYSFDVDGNTYFIHERYTPGADHTYLRINIYGTSHGEYFHVTMNGLEQRPSIEMLSQFGLKEYIKSNNS